MESEKATTSERARILLLIDWVVKDGDWSFLREMLALGHECETAGVEIPRKYNSRLKKVLWLWSGYFRIGLKGFLRRKGFDTVIAYQGVAGLFYSFFKQIFFQRKPQLVLMGFFFKKRSNRLYAALRYYFTKAALAGVDKVMCYSSTEAEYYNKLFRCRKRKFCFVPYGINVVRVDEMLRQHANGKYGRGEKNAAGDSSDFVFSVGSSNRDYRTLFEAVAGLDTRVVVFAKKYNVAGLTVPDNVELRFDVYGDEYNHHLLAAKCIVVPLDDPELSSGQMVLLESMAFGKPVVVTEVWGVTDYVDDGRNAMLVKAGDSRQMREKIETLLKNPVLGKTLGARAKETVFEKFTMQNTAQQVTDAILQ